MFVGAPNEIKQSELAERACDILAHLSDHLSDQPRHRVRQALLSAEVLCIPSKSESFGLAYIEAASCGTPAVGYAPAIRESRPASACRSG